MVDGVGLPIVDYQIAVQNQAQLLTQFQKTPSFSQSVAYYQANIGNVHSVDDLLNNRKLLTVALSAFQLEGSIGETGLLRKLLSQDPNAKGSLAQQLIDPRFRKFAAAFSSLRDDGGASASSPANVNSVLAGFQTNEYQKWISTNDNDPSLRQALFFQQTVEDTIDISNSGKLFNQFQQQQSTLQAVSAFRTGIANVTNVGQLTSNPQLLDFALTAFKIDPASVSSSTIAKLLTEGTTAQQSDPLLTTDPRAAQFNLFVQAFGTLNADGGSQLRTAGVVDAIVSSYQTNVFAQTVATNDPVTTTVDFGANGGDTINTLLGDFRQSSGIGQAISFYQNNIGNVTSVNDLVNNPQLLNVALGAFNIDSTKVSPDVVRQLLTNDPSASAATKAQATSLLQNDPDVARFVQAFGSLGSSGAGSEYSSINSLYQQFQLVPAVQNATSNFEAKIGGITSVAGLIADPTLLNVALTAFNLDPTKVPSSTVQQILTESPAAQAIDPLLTQDQRLANFVQAFGSLNTDGGKELNTQSSISAVVAGYQQNLFAQTLATNDPTTIRNDFGALGAVTIGNLRNSFNSASGVTEAVAQYQANIANVTSPQSLVNNPQVLNVALQAFNLDPTKVSPAVVQQLLVNDPTAPASVQAQANALLLNSTDAANFVAAFSSLTTDGGTQANKPNSIAAITAAFTANQFAQSISAKVQELSAAPSLATATAITAPISAASSVSAITTAYQANQFRQSIATQAQEFTANAANGAISTIQVLGNPTLSAVTLGALGLPAQTGALDPSQQEQILANAGFDPSKLTDPTFLKQFINQFLANVSLQNGSSDPLLALFGGGNGSGSSSDPSLALFGGGGGGGGDGTIPIDLSFLTNGGNLNILA